jgi:hypothetical protein
VSVRCPIGTGSGASVWASGAGPVASADLTCQRCAPLRPDTSAVDRAASPERIGSKRPSGLAREDRLEATERPRQRGSARPSGLTSEDRLDEKSSAPPTWRKEATDVAGHPRPLQGPVGLDVRARAAACSNRKYCRVSMGLTAALSGAAH